MNQTPKLAFSQRPTPLVLQRGGEAALASVFFARISALLFLLALISSRFVLALADGLKQRVPQQDEVKYGHYWHVPGFNWQGYDFGQLMGEFFLLVGAGIVIIALVSAYIVFFRSRKTQDPRVRRMAKWGMILSHFSLLLGVVALFQVADALYSLFLWGFSMF